MWSKQRSLNTSIGFIREPGGEPWMIHHLRLHQIEGARQHHLRPRLRRRVRPFRHDEHEAIALDSCCQCGFVRGSAPDEPLFVVPLFLYPRTISTTSRNIIDRQTNVRNQPVSISTGSSHMTWFVQLVRISNKNERRGWHPRQPENEVANFLYAAFVRNIIGNGPAEIGVDRLGVAPGDRKSEFRRVGFADYAGSRRSVLFSERPFTCAYPGVSDRS